MLFQDNRFGRHCAWPGAQQVSSEDPLLPAGIQPVSSTTPSLVRVAVCCLCCLGRAERIVCWGSVCSPGTNHVLRKQPALVAAGSSASVASEV